MTGKTKQSETFSWISNKSAVAYVTIDNLRRLYISKPTKELMGLPDGKFRLIAGYDFANNRIVLAKPEVVRVSDVKPFNFDKRGYSNAKHFVERANLTTLPIRFLYKGKDYSEYPDGAYCFELDGSTPEDR